MAAYLHSLRRSSAGVIVLVTAGLLGLAGCRDPVPAERTRVLVVPLENATGDASLDPVGGWAADWIGQGLARTGRLLVIPTIDFGPLASIAAVSTGPLSPLEAARANGADLLVSGRFDRNGETLEFSAQISDVASSTVWHALEPVAAAPGPLAGAIDRLSERVIDALATRLTIDVPAEPALTSRPPTLESWTEFRRGADLFTEGAFREAVPYLSRANQLEPSFIRPLLLEASAWRNVGDPARQDSVLSVVARDASRLAPYERAHLDWARASLRGDLNGAYEAGRRTAALAPGGSAGYELGRLALELGRPREALDILGTIDPDAARLPDWWNAWSDITAAHHALGEHERELEIARSALSSRRRAGNAILVVRAQAALDQVAELSETIVEWSEAPADGRVDPGAILWRAALELRAHGDLETADIVLGRAVRWLREAAEAEPTERRRMDLLRALALSGRVGESYLTLAALRSADPQSVEYLGFEGVLAARTGDRITAQRIDRQLAALERPYLRGAHTCRRAAIAAWLDEPERAIELLEQARAEGCSPGFGLHADPDFEPLRGLPAFEAFIAGPG